uniref:Threonine aspartase 1 n=1 Tax=Timema bartmani TaxID=61472 RepID=A0A7R9EUI9_9NEOP|nr:unnamed protein product [Timema bartmani]
MGKEGRNPNCTISFSCIRSRPYLQPGHKNLQLCYVVGQITRVPPKGNVPLTGVRDIESSIGSAPAFSWRESGKPFSKNPPQYTQPGLNSELPIFGSLVQHEISAFDLSATEIVSPLDTVGAVSMDSEGNVASACSSGGIALKHPGRVGQAGVYGCGCWAENTDGQSAIAACTSGCGEYLVKTCLAREVSQDIKEASCCITGLHNTMTNKFTSLSVLPKGIAPGSQVIVEAVPFKRRPAAMDCQTSNYADLTQ